jgi:hypothetical protein
LVSLGRVNVEPSLWIKHPTTLVVSETLSVSLKLS